MVCKLKMLPKCMHYDLNDQQKEKENRVNYAFFIEFSSISVYAGRMWS